MSAAITFQVAREARSACFSQRICSGPRNAVSGPGSAWSFALLGPR